MKKFKIFFPLTACIFFTILMIRCGSSSNPKKVKLQNSTDSVSYVIGLDYGEGIKTQGIDVNTKAVYRGITDGLAGRSLMSDSVKNRIIADFNSKIQKKAQETAMIDLRKNKEKGKKFLDENRKKEGVKELASGLQYSIIKPGTGPLPGPADSLQIHYRAMFTDRKSFDMSYETGLAGLRIGKAIKGLNEGLQLMNTGSIFEFYIPSDLGYGDNDFANTVPAGSTLIYKIELLQIIK